MTNEDYLRSVVEQIHRDTHDALAAVPATPVEPPQGGRVHAGLRVWWCTVCDMEVQPNSGGGHTIPGSMPDNCGPVVERDIVADGEERWATARRVASDDHPKDCPCVHDHLENAFLLGMVEGEERAAFLNPPQPEQRPRS